jgi:CcmD family protein
MMGYSIGERIVADYLVMGVALLTWIGVFVYLVRLNLRVKKLGDSR